jgi:hypothetical protein
MMVCGAFNSHSVPGVRAAGNEREARRRSEAGEFVSMRRIIVSAEFPSAAWSGEEMNFGLSKRQNAACGRQFGIEPPNRPSAAGSKSRKRGAS